MQEQADRGATNLVHHDLKNSSLRSPAKEYVQLKQLVKQRGLLDAQPAYYSCKIFFTLGLLAISVAFLLLVNNFWLQLLNAVYLSFVFTQIGFLAHDIGHRQVFRSTWKNNTGGLVTGNLLIGWSWSWWVDKHNRHHGQPNQIDLDPDLIRPFTAFTGEDASSKRGFARFMVKYQAYFELPTYAFAPVAFLILSVQTLFLKKAKYVLVEALLLACHYLLYFGLLLWRLDAWQVLLFVIVNQAFFGLYVGSVVAPNHKGMPILDKDGPGDFLRQQVLTSRNVKAHPLVDFWYGGLNYQIEHHLFPTMPRNKLKQAQPIIKAFCREHSIAYYETGMLQSYREILRFLHQVSAPIREGKP